MTKDNVNYKGETVSEEFTAIYNADISDITSKTTKILTENLKYVDMFDFSESVPYRHWPLLQDEECSGITKPLKQTSPGKSKPILLN